MPEKSNCKGCIETVMVPEEVIQELIKEAEADGADLVPEEIYLARLKNCDNCSSLVYGTTCSISGSIVRYRAKFKRKCCPLIGDSKWNRVG